MAKIKGITIEIDGKTTGLDKALASVNKSAGNLQKELKGVNTLLKMDPTNTTLLAQKQEILNQSVSKTSEKLKQLKDAQEQVNESFSRGDVSEENYRNFQREIVATENRLKDLTNEQKQFAISAKRLDGVADKFDKIGNSADKAGRKLFGMSKGAGAVVAGATAAMFATEEFSTDLSKMNINAQEAGVGLGVTEKAFKAFAVATDEVDSSVEATSNLLQAGFTESNLQTAVEGLTGAYLKFPDTLKIEGLADSLQETLATGKSMGMFGEMLDRVGVGADNFNKQLAECSTTAEKQDLILKTLEAEGLNGTYEAWTKQNKVLKDQKEVQLQAQLALSKFGMTISSVVMPALLPLVEKLTALAEKFANLSMGQKKAIVGFTLLLAGLAPTLIAIGKMATGLGALTRGLGAVAPALKGLKALFMGLSFNPFVLVVAGVTALLLALGLANSGSDETKEKLSGIATTVGQMFRQLPNIIMTGFNSLLARLPELAQMGIRMLDYLLNGLIQAMPKITAQLPVIITTIVSGITTLLPKIIDIGIKLIVALANGLIKALPTIMKSIPVIIKALVGGIIKLLPQLIKTGVELIKALWKGFKSWVSSFIKNVVSFAKSIPGKIKTGLGSLVKIGLSFIKTLWNGFKSFVSTFISNVVGFAKGIPTSIKNGLGSLFNIGSDLIKGLWNGINNVTDWIIEKIGGFTEKVLNAIKSFFGIKSPSRYTAEDGKFLVQGLAKGILDNTKLATQTVKKFCGRIGEDFKGGMATALDKTLDKTKEKFDAIKDNFKAAMEDIKTNMNDLISNLTGNSNLFAEAEELKEEVVPIDPALIEKNALEGADKMRYYFESIKQLKARNLPDGLFDELFAMGPEGQKNVDAFLSMSEEQLNNVINAYNDKLKTASNISELIYGEDVEKLEAKTVKQFAKAGLSAGKSIKTALDKSTKISAKQAQTMANNLTDKMLNNMLTNIRNAVAKMKAELRSIGDEQNNLAMPTSATTTGRSTNVNQTVNVVNPKGTPADIAREVRNKANMQLLGVL